MISRQFFSFISSLLVATLFFTAHSNALKFAVPARPAGSGQAFERCIRNFVHKDAMVVVNVKTNGQRGDGQVLNLRVGFSFIAIAFGVLRVKL